MKNTINILDQLISQNNIQNLNFISNIFFVRDHINFNTKYQFIESKNKIFYFLKILIMFVLKRINSIRYNFQKKIIIGKLSNFDYVFITHIMKNEKHNLKQDYIYGKLFDEILKKNQKICLIFFNQTKFHIKHLKSNFKENKNITYILFNNKANFFTDILNFELLIKLLIELLKNKKNISKKIFLFLIYSIFEEETLSNIRIFKFFSNLKYFKFNKVILTYEGHSYERNIIKALKENNSCEVYAYQHSGIYEGSHGIFQNKYPNNILPDKFLLSGKVGYNLFKKKFKSYNANNFIIIGSPRYQKVKVKKYDNLNNKSKNILLLPDGTSYETSHYIDLANKLAHRYKEFTFFLKFHPSQYLFINKNPKLNNLIYLKQDIQTTLKNNNFKFAIYSSTTSILNVISNGIIPIYFLGTKNLQSNPIYMFYEKRFSVNQIEDFKSILNFKDKKKFVNKIIKKTTNYYEKINVKNFLDL